MLTGRPLYLYTFRSLVSILWWDFQPAAAFQHLLPTAALLQGGQTWQHLLAKNIHIGKMSSSQINAKCLEHFHESQRQGFILCIWWSVVKTTFCLISRSLEPLFLWNDVLGILLLHLRIREPLSLDRKFQVTFWSLLCYNIAQANIYFY